jgi:hypothetical protein
MLNDYKCSECGFTDEYSTSPSVPKAMNPPEMCPKCNKGKMEKIVSFSGQSFDPGIGTYSYEHGKYAWKKRMSADQQAKVLNSEIDPY